MATTKATKTTPAPTTDLVVVGKLEGRDITAPNMTRKIQAMRTAAEQYKSYANTIDCEDTKIFIASVLQELVRDRNEQRRELAKITDPLKRVRADALSSMRAAENLFEPYFAGSEIGERILKAELVRWDGIVTQRRLAAEAEAQRKADEEQRRLEDLARAEAEEAARKALEEQQRAQELEEQGRQAEAETARQQSDAALEESAIRVEQTIQEAENTQPAIVYDDTVKTKGTAITGKWVCDVVDVKEVLAGIVAGETPWDAVRVKVTGRLVAIGSYSPNMPIDGIEINLPWFADKARKEGENFNYRGFRAHFKKDVRVTV